jgi:rare lipoprotein A
VRLGGQWWYPREDFSLDQRGIAIILASRLRQTANGEAAEPHALVAAHPTLQLPAIVTVTNLETGRALRLRINERGPDAAGRILAVSPRAAELLGAQGPFQARLVVDADASRTAIRGLAGQGPQLAIAAAPVERVDREALAPPAGARVAPAVMEAQRRATAGAQAEAPADATAMRLPEQVQQLSPQPGRLFIEGPRFFRRDFAQAQAMRLGFRAEPLGPPGRQQQWRVIGGPFGSLAEADAIFSRAQASGQQDLRLVVE